MKKRFSKSIALLTVITMILAVMGITAFGAEAETIGGKCGENAFWSYDRDTGVVTVKGSGEMTPLSSDDFDVETCFSNGALKTIVIENGITGLSDDVFNVFNASYLKSVTTVVIPNSVTKIGSGAFNGCNNLTSIEIPGSVKSIGEEAFMFCSALTKIVIPDSVTDIDNYAFANCMNLKEIKLSNKLTNLGTGAFAVCVKLTDIAIPESLSEIKEDTFISCISLTSITIPSNITSVGRDAFYLCNSLTDIKVEGDTDISASQLGLTNLILKKTTVEETAEQVTAFVNAEINFYTGEISEDEFNAICVPYEKWMNEHTVEVDDAFVISNAVISCYKESKAADYAIANNIRCNYLDENGHDFSLIEKAAACTQTGSIIYTCRNCGYEYVEEIPATGHADKDGNNVCDACGESLGNSSSKTIIEKIQELLQKIIEFFSSLFSIK